VEGSACYLICDTILGFTEGTEETLHENLLQSSRSPGEELNTQTSHIEGGSATHWTGTLMSRREVFLIG